MATNMHAVAQDSGAPADRLVSAATAFQPLDPGVVNAAIPAFFIGRNKDGFWLARDVKGKVGAVFLFESSAVAFARKNSRPLGCATIFPSDRFELDVENRGNPLIARLRPLARLAAQARRRATALVGRLAKAVDHPLKGLGVR